MLVQTYDKFLIETAQRIDIRYYLIKVNEKYYIIDYSNPRDIKSFFHRIQYNVQTKIAWVSIIFILVLLNGMLFPKFY